MTLKTPGVYVREITTFPPSVVPVETAVPAFVGYTEKAGRDLTNVPTRIESLLHFEDLFGGPFVPDQYKVQVEQVQADTSITSITPQHGTRECRYYLHGCLRHFYANGGGACYIVSVGSYSDDVDLGSDSGGLQGGLQRLASLDEPTLLLFPDGVSLGASGLAALQDAALTQCKELQDRFMITDLHDGDLAGSTANDPVANFRNSSLDHLCYGAAYYPWVRTIYRPEIGFRHLEMVDSTNEEIPVETLDTLTGDTDIDSLVSATRRANGVVEEVVEAVAIDEMSGSPITLDRDSFAALSDHFVKLLKLLREGPAGQQARNRFHNLIRLPRAIALAFPALDAEDDGPPDLPEDLRVALRHLKSDPQLTDAIVQLIALEKNEDLRKTIAQERDEGDVVTDYAALDGGGWLGNTDQTVAGIEKDGSSFEDSETPRIQDTALNAAAALRKPFDTLAAGILSLFETAEYLAGDADRRLFAEHPVYRDAAEQAKRAMSLLPASGAIAGVYAATDLSRGVWKAPANVPLADTVGPAVPLSDQDQADLNVHVSGKSINAIRAFAGKGTLVWGARTLAGNDNEWRYVPVRRFFIMAEESIKKATEPFVFEPNDANTWVRVRAMIEGFLTLQWRQGALAGATPAEAFFVKVGLGETMTAQDILEGRMFVEVGMAVVRPAEFIVLKFAHKMQVS